MMDEQLSISYSGGSSSSNYPVMISSISSESMHFGNALIYCADLEEDGYSDWFLPNLDQLAYAVSGGCELPDERSSSFLWTTSKSHDDSYNNEIILLNESTDEGMISYIGDNGFTYCRCARFGEGGTSDGSSGSSNSLGSSSSLGSGSESITMFGPMYIYTECDETCLNVDYLFGAQQSNELYYFEALAFCSQLEYEGYDDWRLPSLKELSHWVSINNDNVLPIPNFPVDGTGYGMFFLNMKDGVYTNSNPRVYIGSYANMLNLDNGGLGKCFCVR